MPNRGASHGGRGERIGEESDQSPAAGPGSTARPVFTRTAWEQYLSHTDRRLVRRINDLIADIIRNGDEAQLNHDARKRRSWLVYLATLHARLGCPVMLLVVCPTRSVAAWSAKPISVGHPGLVLAPLVLGPDRVPVVTDPALARISPELTVLSVLAHSSQPGQSTALFEALLAALDVVDHEHANLYADVVLAALPAAARDCLEAFMTTVTHQYQSDFARRYFDLGRSEGEAEGEAKGEAKAVLAFLDARGIEVPEDIRDEIATCTDLEQLDSWVRRAATATKIQDLFA